MRGRFDEQFDAVLIAAGEKAVVKTDRQTARTTIPAVFAAGAAAGGASKHAVQAVGDGHFAARAIIAHLAGLSPISAPPIGTAPVPRPQGGTRHARAAGFAAMVARIIPAIPNAHNGRASRNPRWAGSDRRTDACIAAAPSRTIARSARSPPPWMPILALFAATNAPTCRPDRHSPRWPHAHARQQQVHRLRQVRRHRPGSRRTLRAGMDQPRFRRGTRPGPGCGSGDRPRKLRRRLRPGLSHRRSHGCTIECGQCRQARDQRDRRRWAYVTQTRGASCPLSLYAGRGIG